MRWLNIGRRSVGVPDLWPTDLMEEPGELAPVEILREQAALLGKKTRNRVEAEVKLIPAVGWSVGRLEYVFWIVAPTLYGYRYGLFNISHGELSYPLTIQMDGDVYREILHREPDEDAGKPLVVNSEAEFLDILKQILGASKTRRIIGSLISQVTAWPEPHSPRPAEET